ncbi:LemA family protein [Companilactobacillus sp.]|uniref:LemA family protein n=1 Tax=Companilactobacillus sp. TaxID=2767905 RepID=UPI0025B95D21|nr:LemA family protein [Companilactobacillus sp.]MCH4008516.1 LemA family protein [Companilactobacillus sp.]MCH4051305.1 LemA family protein [Companilactobacillus sp.]MCH4076459.1 LemA family protein [Companilactobacillus sp.]MCH4125034.1 LemA family protein [Companilactobacillus sp.]MCH4131575.1 LemA family protein [Companilactobacillus sp.]
MIALIIIVILVLLVVAYVAMYNGLVKYRNRAQEFSSQIDVQLKRRTDLIPNLVETVKGYATHEQETLTKVVQSRNQLVAADSASDKAQADNALTGALRQVFALSESYPNLKADTEFQKLMEELSNTENKVSYARQAYNSQVQQYDTAIETFPRNIIAGIHHFQNIDFISIPEADKEVPKVKF